MVQVHNFDWEVYAKNIMPAFEQWLIKDDETAVQSLFSQTRCAQEEQFLPGLIRKLSIWPRACAFIATLPRGPHSLREYHQICSARQFTSLSDRYLHHHAPRLYQESDALRTIWGSLVEEHCISWFPPAAAALPNEVVSDVSPDDPILQTELLHLLQTAGLDTVARQLHQAGVQVERIEWETNIYNFLINERTETSPTETLPTNAPPIAEDEDEDEAANLQIKQSQEGINLGCQTDQLQLRGWLAGASLRALVLFELLAFGRRCMPFGYNHGEPFGSYIGYLTPDEVCLLEEELHTIAPPDPRRIRDAQQQFRASKNTRSRPYRFTDEISPVYAGEFLNLVRIAAYQKRGLLCETD